MGVGGREHLIKLIEEEGAGGDGGGGVFGLVGGKTKMRDLFSLSFFGVTAVESIAGWGPRVHRVPV
jgi:hypothetical protein